ncbi:MAG: CBS domain-containing protein [Oscillospiraceae bacterium]|jgi:CBS domain-containing protein|nr:CBS domain-containing protein [Oscillospiraceae bacterium]
MRVSELMNANVVSITPDEPALLAARLLSRHNIGSLPVCSLDGKLRGMVTDRDIVLRCVATESDPQTMRVREIMTRGIVSVSPEDDVREAAHKMANEQVRRLPVVSAGGSVVGMLSLGDMAKSRALEMEAANALSEISVSVKKS